ncbi:transposase [Streptomyces sp. NPDC056191]
MPSESSSSRCCPSRCGSGSGWKSWTRTAWRDMPERFGPWATLHTRFRRWAADGTFDLMLLAAQAKADAVDWLASVGSTVVRAHQHAARAREGASGPGSRPIQRRPEQQDPIRPRLPGPSAGLRRNGRQHQRLHPVHRLGGRDPGALSRTRAAPHPVRSRTGRQGLQLEGDPGLAAIARHPARDSPAGRSGLKQWRRIATRYGKTAQS